MGGGGVDGMEDKREEGGKYTWTDTSRLGGIRGGVKLGRVLSNQTGPLSEDQTPQDLEI